MSGEAAQSALGSLLKKRSYSPTEVEENHMKKQRENGADSTGDIYIYIYTHTHTHIYIATIKSEIKK